MNAKRTLQKIICCVLIIPAAILIARAQAPTHTARFAPVIHSNINGFYEYLPRNYDTDVNTKYPLLVFFHAMGETGSVPDMATLDTITTWGPPKLIHLGLFPDSFYVGGQWLKFIVISPQIKPGVWNSPDDDSDPSVADAVIEYAKANYRIDLTRIYMCGMSMGGAATWEYAGSSAAAANKLAAIVVACGAGDLTTAQANIVAASNLPVLATHNKGDEVVGYQRTDANALLINSYSPAISPGPRIVKWEGGDHNVWSRTYEDINPGIASQGYSGNLRDTLGVNVYEWMLQFTRANVVLPVSWQHFSVQEANGAALLRWTVEQQINVQAYTVEKSSDGLSWVPVATLPAQNNSIAVKADYQYADAAVFQDTFFYRIRQTDSNGKYNYSAVQKFVATGKKRVLIIFPNPFREQIVINYTAGTQKNIVVKLVDAAGRIFIKRVYAASSGNNVISINNVKHFSTGVYYAIVEEKSGAIISKTRLMKE